MKLAICWINKRTLLATATLGLAFALQSDAQVQTTTTRTAGETRYTVAVNRGEVYAVDGNDLVVKMEDGTFRHFPNVPESARATVDGKELGIHDLKPGMKLQRTIVTTETPMIVTTIQTVKGKVWYINPPNSVILTLENNTNQEFKIPKNQKFNVDGQMVDAFALRKGMNVTATKIVEVPTVAVAQEKSVTGTAPQAAPAPAAAPKEVATKPQHVTGTVPPSPPPEAPLLVASGEPTPVPAETETPAAPPTEQPAPAAESHFPWLGLGVLLLVVLLAIWFIRSKSKK